MRTLNVSVAGIDGLELIVGPQMLGEIYLNLGYITQSQLDNALDYQRRKGGRLGWIMGILGYVNRLQLFEGLAEHYRLEFIGDFQFVSQHIDRDLAKELTPQEMVENGVIPFSLDSDADVLTVVTSNPGNRDAWDFLHQKFEITNVKEKVITDLDFMNLCEYLGRDVISDISIRGLIKHDPDQSASTTFSKGQLVFFVVLVASLATWAFFSERTVLLAAIVVVQFYYLGTLSFKVVVSAKGLTAGSKADSSGKAAELVESELPVYSVLVPVYKEPEVIGTLIRSLKKLDYPEDKLDIILLLEKNDSETLEAAKLRKPPVSWRFLIVPDSGPKTKPKACNYGLQFARGQYLTIFDAEDIPDSDQLKKAVVAFRQNPDYFCFQAALNFFNEKENMLTRMFTIEYSGWYDCMLPGLFRSKLPIPLGGTSNHFDIRKLRELGAWDPYNVTEDADLGIRASVAGYKVGVIDSSTYEEANSRVNNWIRQRSRWIKGFMLTFLVHNRHPIRAIKTMGIVPWLSYNLIIGGTPATLLLNPPMWVLFIYSLFGHIDHLAVPPVLFYVSMFNLLIGNSLAVLTGMVGVLPRKKYHLVLYTLLVPFYWMLQSAAAYKALWQLITKPHFWEKTDHGISNFSPVEHVKTIIDNSEEAFGLEGNPALPVTQKLAPSVVGIIAASTFFILLILVAQLAAVH